MILRIVPFNFPSLGYPKVDIEIPEAFETAEFDPGTLSASPLIDMYRSFCHGPNLTGGLHDTIWSNNNDDRSLIRIILEDSEDEGMPSF